MSEYKIGFGGGCHWCTEAVFQHLRGVEKVEQGWIASTGKNQSFSEAVIVHFNPEIIPLKILTEVHLRTHNSTSNHSMREKYRSAIYIFSREQKTQIQYLLADLQGIFNAKIITKVLFFKHFKPSREEIQNYYLKNPKKPFCKLFIDPKLQLLLDQFNAYIEKGDYESIPSDLKKDFYK